ncbi:MAG: hypothetical protein WB817_18060, partial [Terriglobales bacterium]
AKMWSPPSRVRFWVIPGQNPLWQCVSGMNAKTVRFSVGSSSAVHLRQIAFGEIMIAGSDK